MHNYLKISLCVVLAAYLAVALVVASTHPDEQACKGVSITVEPTEGADGFVTRSEIASELGAFADSAAGTPLASINTQTIRRRLLGLDKLEDASVVRYTDGTVRISVKPIVPVARVFEGRDSYYINRSGKRVRAGARFRKNVPIIRGRFDPADSLFTPLSLLPLIDYIAADSIWNTYITMIDVKGPRDVILVPAIREHVINIGSPDDIEQKLGRLRTFYTRVLAGQGWEKYDTISLKWRGQIVATKRHKAAAQLPVSAFDEDEAVSVDAMLAGDDVAPGQAVPGVKAHTERPIPRKK